MNDQQFKDKVCKDATNVKKDIHTLVGDGTAQIGRIENDVYQTASKAKEDVTTWVGDSVSQLSGELERITDDAKETVSDAATAVKKDVEHGLSQYNAKAQELADKVPGNFGKKVTRFPWVAISIALVVGFLLGSLLKPTGRLLG